MVFGSPLYNRTYSRYFHCESIKIWRCNNQIISADFQIPSLDVCKKVSFKYAEQELKLTYTINTASSVTSSTSDVTSLTSRYYILTSTSVLFLKLFVSEHVRQNTYPFNYCCNTVGIRNPDMSQFLKITKSTVFSKLFFLIIAS